MTDWRPWDAERMVRLMDLAARRRWLLAGVVGLVLVAVVAFLALDGGDEGELPGLTSLAQAAERTAEYPGARMAIQGSFEVPGRGTPLTMSGKGVYNGETGLSRITMATEGAQVPGGGFEIEQVAEQRPGKMVMYMRSASFGELPGGAEWMMLDLSEEAAGTQSFDPRDQLKMLRSSKDFERLDTERVRGVATTRYRAVVDQGDEVKRLRDEGHDAAADSLEQVIEINDGVDTMPVEAWVDRDRTIRRLRMEFPFAMGMAPRGSTMLMTMDMYDFGIEPHVSLPPESEVFDATEVAEAGLDQLAD